MHILLTNDDGPPHDACNPYMKYFVDEINSTTDWDLSIVVPNQQRSWIGKAHFANKTLTATYIYTKHSTETKNAAVNAFQGPYNQPQGDLVGNQDYQEWCLIDSTPAACADLGIHHIYSDRKQKPLDLVISGPNFGKNSGNVYIMSSGTVGAAMEAVTHGVKSIALSYSYNSINHNHEVLKEAARISVRLIKKLYRELQRLTEIDLFSVNVPLVESLKLGSTRIHYAPVFQNIWNSIYSKIDELSPLGQQQFKWAPDFKKVHKDSLQDLTHCDTRVLLDEQICVTPMKATFSSINSLQGEITLEDDDDDTSESNNLSLLTNKLNLNNNNIVILITLAKESYIYKPLIDAFTENLDSGIVTGDKSVLQKIPDNPSLKVFHYGEYEEIDLDLISSVPNQYFISTYIYRKALIRKHYLANTIHHYVAKNPLLILKRSVPETYQLEVDYAEFLDDSLDEAYELREEVQKGTKTWILKPSMSDKGQGIRLFKTIDQLQQIFDSFEQDSDKEDDNGEGQSSQNGVIVSQLRHFIVQEYMSNPLLLSKYSNKKFHLRAYVVCCGDLKVYLYKNILALFADETYQTPRENHDNEIPMSGHLTNTCIQKDQNPLVVPFWDLDDTQLPVDKKQWVFDQVAAITGELYQAASSVDKLNFQPLRNAIEFFGIDYLVNQDYSVTLLEVNSYPDFKQTGDDLKDIVTELFQDSVQYCVASLINSSSPTSTGSLLSVLDQSNPYK